MRIFWPILVLTCLGTAPHNASAQVLEAPFVAREPGADTAAKPCQPSPPPVIELAVISKYGNDGPARDTVDPDADAAFKAQMEPVVTLRDGVVGRANAYTRTGSRAQALCALSWLDDWAKADGFSRMQNGNANFQLAEALSGLSLAMLQIAPAVRADPRYEHVTVWMRGLAYQMVSYYDSTQNLRGSRNNHEYWAGQAAAGVSVVANDPKLLDWAVKVYKVGVCGATREGALPLEVGRGKKALSYHLFALDALLPIAAIAETNHIQAYELCDGALHHIVSFTLSAASDPSRIVALSGKPQDPFEGGLPSKGQLAFLEIYSRAYPGRAPGEAEMLARRPLSETKMGGDQTLLYGNR